MTGIKIDMTVFPCRIVWDEAVAGITRLTQNVVTNYRTSAGSDVVVARGNNLAATMRAGGMYDAMNAQHALNFAVIQTSDFTRRSGITGAAESLKSLTATIAGSASRRLAVDLRVTNQNDETVVMPAHIPQ